MSSNPKLRIGPLTIRQANALITAKHRHHKSVTGHRFSLGCFVAETLVGAAVTGRPVARNVDPYQVAEVTRLVSDGTPHVCSMLYAASARAAQAMGFHWIQTYILESETGKSLEAAGWLPIYSTGWNCGCKQGQKCAGCLTSGGDWNRKTRKDRRTDQPMCQKQRWGKRL